MSIPKPEELDLSDAEVRENVDPARRLYDHLCEAGGLPPLSYRDCQRAMQAVLSPENAELSCERRPMGDLGWFGSIPVIPGELNLLDLYCCEGGAAVGYHRAGFRVFGVDLFEDYSQKRYPFGSYKGDAIRFVVEHGHLFDAIHASPPCQHATAGTRAQDRSRYPRLIEPTREALIATGKPYIIENVRGADLIDPVELCGCMFDLTAVDTDGILLHLQRARRFESNVQLSAPRPCDHSDHEWVGGSYGGARRDKYEAKYERHGGYVPSIPVQRELLGIDWMTQRGMHQSIPPAYTEHLGRQLMAHLIEQREAA